MDFKFSYDSFIYNLNCSLNQKQWCVRKTIWWNWHSFYVVFGVHLHLVWIFFLLFLLILLAVFCFIFLWLFHSVALSLCCFCFDCRAHTGNTICNTRFLGLDCGFRWDENNNCGVNGIRTKLCVICYLKFRISRNNFFLFLIKRNENLRRV